MRKSKSIMVILAIILISSVVFGENISKDIDKANILLDMYAENRGEVTKEGLVEAIYGVDDDLERGKLIGRMEAIEKDIEDTTEKLVETRNNSMMVFYGVTVVCFIVMFLSFILDEKIGRWLITLGVITMIVNILLAYIS